MNKQDQIRFDQVINHAQTAFWESVVAEYTEAKTGELSLGTTYFLEKALREVLSEWVEYNVPPFENKTTEILLHDIEYWYRDADETMEISECDIEHITNMIIQGYNQGELCTLDDNDKSWYGWWKIKK